MDNRIELTDEFLENISGGAFTYYDKDGNGEKDTCVVDGVGTYHCNGSSKSKITNLYLQDMNVTPAELVQKALKAGYLW